MARKKSTLSFATKESSPFPDGYDIEAERARVQHLIDADEPDPANADYPRYVLYCERLRQLELMQQESVVRQQADSMNTNAEAKQIDAIGGLATGEDDTMSLHTREAMRLFLGRQNNPGDKGHSVVGGRRVAAALRQLWALSSNDNPYADYALVEFDQRVEAARTELAGLAQQYQKQIDERRAMGINYAILKSSQPAEVHLAFRSPYGYSVAELISTADWVARVIKSVQMRNIISREEAREALYVAQNLCRSIFERVVYFQRYLSREELRPLSRGDFLPSADESGQKRVQAVYGIFNQCPKDVFMKTRTPRHSRSISLSPEEFRLLNEVQLRPEVDHVAGADLGEANLV